MTYYDIDEYHALVPCDNRGSESQKWWQKSGSIENLAVSEYVRFNTTLDT